MSRGFTVHPIIYIYIYIYETFPSTCTGVDRHHRVVTPIAADTNSQIAQLTYQQALYTEFHPNRSEMYKANIMIPLSSYRLVSGFRTEIRHQGYG